MPTAESYAIKNAVKEFESREDSFVLKDIADQIPQNNYSKYESYLKKIQK